MRINKTFTITSGTPINVATGLSTAVPQGVTPVWLKRIFIQMLSGGAGVGYVMDGIAYGNLPSTANDSDVTAELSAASADESGGVYSDTDPARIDGNMLWIDGANSGDTIKVSYVI